MWWENPVDTLGGNMVHAMSNEAHSVPIYPCLAVKKLLNNICIGLYACVSCRNGGHGYICVDQRRC